MTNWTKRSERIRRESGHDTQDSDCRFWAGDFAGVNLYAECSECKAGR
jgi:hypothetical protein